MCEQKDIHLIHIYEDDWMFKNDIIKSRLLNLLKKSFKIYARKCQIKEIKNTKIVKDFLEKNHLQGFIGSKVKIGLFYNNELVSLMTFSMKHKNDEEYYEISRFCNKLNNVVIGGASKLLNYFINKYKPNEVISYADRSWSNGDLYLKLKFQFIHKTKPDYYYIIERKRKHRFGFRKDVLIKKGHNPNKTEHQIMSEKYFYKIYDSGSLKFSFKKENIKN